MTVYFDKTNLESLLRSRMMPEYEDVERMVKNQLNVSFNFTQEEMRSGPSAGVLGKFLTLFTAGRGDLLKPAFLDTPFPPRPVKQNAHSHFDHLVRPVMLVDDEKAAAYHDTKACLIGEVGKEVEILYRLQRPNGDYEFETTLHIGEPEFSRWEQLQQHCLPCYDVIISDRYLLNCDEDTLESNYIKLLQSLLYDKKVKVNIVLITLHPDTRTSTWTYEEIRSRTKEAVEKVTGKAPNFTLVWANDPKTVRHDRHIITNYQWFQSGDSFNYFSSAGSVITQGDTLTIKSMARAQNRYGASVILRRFQERIDNVRKLNSDSVKGDKTSSFLRLKDEA